MIIFAENYIFLNFHNIFEEYIIFNNALHYQKDICLRSWYEQKIPNAIPNRVKIWETVLPLQEEFGFDQTYRKTSSQSNIQVEIIIF